MEEVMEEQKECVVVGQDRLDRGYDWDKVEQQEGKIRSEFSGCIVGLRQDRVEGC